MTKFFKLSLVQYGPHTRGPHILPRPLTLNFGDRQAQLHLSQFLQRAENGEEFPLIPSLAEKEWCRFSRPSLVKETHSLRGELSNAVARSARERETQDPSLRKDGNCWTPQKTKF